MFGVIRSIPRGAKRIQLTAKQGHHFYKGTGSGAMGRHTKSGGYKVDWTKVRTFVVPDLGGFTIMTRYAKLGGKAKHVKTSDEFNVTPLVPTKKASHQETPQSNGPEPASNKDKSDHNDSKKRPNKQTNKKRKFDNTADDSSTRKDRRNRAKDRNTICFGCRQKGHSVENCKESKQSIQGICYNCGSTEHSLKHCKKPRKGNALPYAKCFVCDGKGHLAGQCPENTKGLYPNGGGCRFCGQVDHLAKDCKVTKDQAGTTVVGKIDLDQGADDDDYHIFVTEQRKHTKEVAEEKKIASPVVDRRPAQKKKVVKF